MTGTGLRQQAVFLAVVLLVFGPGAPAKAEQAFGIEIAPEQQGYTYERDLYRHWIDADGDRLDTRHEVLLEESLVPPTINASGRVVSGLWAEPYTGLVTHDPGDLQIDHMVPLKEAHESGAHAWTAEQREAFANDLALPDALIAVKGAANGSKGARDPAEWMPPNRAYWCSYLAAWVAVKVKYKLTADQAEADALEEGFRVCDEYRSGDRLEGRH